MKCRWAIVTALAVCAPVAAAAEAPPTLTHYRCYICHSDHNPLVGPAFADVAKSYHGRADAVDTIARDIRDGLRTGGPWHMPPHPEVSVSDARAMARYIMSLEPSPPPAVQEVKRPATATNKEKP